MKIVFQIDLYRVDWFDRSNRSIKPSAVSQVGSCCMNHAPLQFMNDRPRLFQGEQYQIACLKLKGVPYLFCLLKNDNKSIVEPPIPNVSIKQEAN